MYDVPISNRRITFVRHSVIFLFLIFSFLFFNTRNFVVFRKISRMRNETHKFNQKDKLIAMQMHIIYARWLYNMVYHVIACCVIHYTPQDKTAKGDWEWARGRKNNNKTTLMLFVHQLFSGFIIIILVFVIQSFVRSPTDSANTQKAPECHASYERGNNVPEKVIITDWENCAL